MSPLCPLLTLHRGNRCPSLSDLDLFFPVRGITSSSLCSCFHSAVCLWGPSALLPVVVWYLFASLCSTPVCEYTRLCSIHSTTNGPLGNFQVLPITNSVAANILVWYVSFGEYVRTFLLGIYLDIGVLGQRSACVLFQQKLPKSLPKWQWQLTLPLVSSDYSTCHPPVVLSAFFILTVMASV